MIPPHSHSQAGFALASLFGILGTTPLILGLARLGQGAGASAFPPRPRLLWDGLQDRLQPAATLAIRVLEGAGLRARPAGGLPAGISSSEDEWSAGGLSRPAFSHE